MVSDRATTRRARQAEQTRHEIVVAARGLFATKGYAATSVAEIASEAGVSVKTIYDSLGSKAAIVQALNDLVDDEGDVAALAGRMATSSHPVELLGIAVAISRNINERCADIVGAVFSAAPVEVELEAVRLESRRRHREGVGRLSRRLDSLAALQRGLTVEKAADIIAALTDPQVARTFVLEYGWSWDLWHEWTLEALTGLVLAARR